MSLLSLTKKVWSDCELSISLQRVFHGIRLLRLED